MTTRSLVLVGTLALTVACGTTTASAWTTADKARVRDVWCPAFIDFMSDGPISASESSQLCGCMADNADKVFKTPADLFDSDVDSELVEKWLDHC